MNFHDIMTVLPYTVSVELQENLDSMNLTVSSTPAEVRELIQSAASLTKLGDAYLHDLDDEKRRMVDVFLRLLPDEGVKVIFA